MFGAILMMFSTHCSANFWCTSSLICAMVRLLGAWTETYFAVPLYFKRTFKYLSNPLLNSSSKVIISRLSRPFDKRSSIWTAEQEAFPATIRRRIIHHLSWTSMYRMLLLFANSASFLSLTDQASLYTSYGLTIQTPIPELPAISEDSRNVRCKQNPSHLRLALCVHQSRWKH